MGTIETAAANYRRVQADLVVARSGRQARLMGQLGPYSSAAEQSSASTQQVSASTEETSASAEEITASAQKLAATAQSLERLVSQFRI